MEPPARAYVADEPLGGHGDPHVFNHGGREIKLCCAGCLNAFHKDPAVHLAKLDQAESVSETVRPGPHRHHSAAGIAQAVAKRMPASKYFCPRCGMALEAKTVSLPDDGSDRSGSEEASLRRKLWLSVALALPVLVLAMKEMIPALRAREWMPEKGLFIPRVEGFQSVTGAGVTGKIDGVPVRVGKRSWLEAEGVAIPSRLPPAQRRSRKRFTPSSGWRRVPPLAASSPWLIPSRPPRRKR